MNEKSPDPRVRPSATPPPARAPQRKTPAPSPIKRPVDRANASPPNPVPPNASPAKRTPGAESLGKKPASPSSPVRKTIAKPPVKTARTDAASPSPNPGKPQPQPSRETGKNPGTLVQKYPPRKGGLLRSRLIRTDTISQVYYKLSEKHELKKYIAGIVILSILIIATVVGYSRLWNDQNQSSTIVKAIDEGMTSLLNDKLEEARSSLQISLDIYRSYHIDNPKVWWKRDAPLFIRMLKSAQGWRSLGDYKNGLLTFEAVAQHNTTGYKSSVGEQMETELTEFINGSHWSPEEMKEIYLYMLEIPPSSWGSSDILLIRATERLGLSVFPLADRLKNANLVIYGTPAPMRLVQDESMTVNVIRAYKVDSLPETVALKLSSDLSLTTRQRLLWYSKANQKCMIFAKNPKEPTVGNSESVVLSEPYIVDEFNRLYKE
jgi:hypothetical protein